MTFKQWVLSINHRIDNLALKITNNVKIKTPQYYFELERLVSSPLVLDDDIHLNLNKSFEIKESKNLISHLSANSDLCLSLLIHENDTYKCNTNDNCVAFLIENSSSGYYLTHQLAFFIISKNVSL